MTTSESLIKPATIQEQVLGKISEMRRNNLTAQQKKDIENVGDDLIVHFVWCSRHYFGLSIDQILELSDREIEALFSLVHVRAKRCSMFSYILLGIPIFGWFVFAMAYDCSKTCKYTFEFTRSANKLRKILGDNFKPSEIFRSKLINLKKEESP